MRHLPAARQSAFYWKNGEPSQLTAELGNLGRARERTAAQVAKARAEGRTLSVAALDGSRGSQRYRHSPPVKGGEAGQHSTDRREAIRRGGR